MEARSFRANTLLYSYQSTAFTHGSRFVLGVNQARKSRERTNEQQTYQELHCSINAMLLKMSWKIVIVQRMRAERRKSISKCEENRHGTICPMTNQHKPDTYSCLYWFYELSTRSRSIARGSSSTILYHSRHVYEWTSVAHAGKYD